MSISTIIAKVILKILEAFGIKPSKIDIQILKTDAFPSNYGIKPRPVETLGPPTVSKDSCGHKSIQEYRAEFLKDALKKAEPAKPRTLGTPGSAGPDTVDADPGGSQETPISFHEPPGNLRGPVEYPNKTDSDRGPILPPEATDPTDAPGWIDDKYGVYDPNWKQK